MIGAVHESRRATRRRKRGRKVADQTADEVEMRRRLAALRVEHRDLDTAIAALDDASSADQLQLARLKKRKLRLRDEIARIEDGLIPDIIA